MATSTATEQGRRNDELPPELSTHWIHSREEDAGPGEATGMSRNLSFDEAFADALARYRRPPPSTRNS